MQEQISINQAIADFIAETLQSPETKKSPAMVAAIAELSKVIMS